VNENGEEKKKEHEKYASSSPIKKQLEKLI